VNRKYNCSFFHPENGLNGSTNIKVRAVHFALGLYRLRTGHKEGPEGVKMGAGICLFMYPRKWDLLHWVWDLTIVKDFSYDTCCLSPKTLLKLCLAFYTWASGSDDPGNPIPRIDVNKLIDWLIDLFLIMGRGFLSFHDLWQDYLTQLLECAYFFFFFIRIEYSVPVDLSKHIRILSVFYFLPSRPIPRRNSWSVSWSSQFSARFVVVVGEMTCACLRLKSSHGNPL